MKNLLIAIAFIITLLKKYIEIMKYLFASIVFITTFFYIQFIYSNEINGIWILLIIPYIIMMAIISAIMIKKREMKKAKSV